jgi:choline-sulfatase
LVELAIRKLREIGKFDNTIIVYCTDHGDFALEHGICEKAPGISYDAILRTPLIWSWPAGNLKAGTVEELAESVDVFPTLCGLLGVKPPDTVDGLDISPMLRGDAKPVRDFVVAEFPLSRTIRTKEWKLCHRPLGMFKDGKDWGELYHVSEDPWEMRNEYHDSQHHQIREDLRRRYFDWLQMTTRFGNFLTEEPAGKDGKTTLMGLRKHIDRDSINYL